MSNFDSSNECVSTHAPLLNLSLVPMYDAYSIARYIYLTDFLRIYLHNLVVLLKLNIKYKFVLKSWQLERIDF